MLFGKKRTDQIAKAIEEADENGYWAIVRKQFYKNRLAVWSLRLFYGVFFIALMADFIANERPIYCILNVETQRDTTDVKLDTLIEIDTILLNNDDKFYDSQNTNKTLDQQVEVPNRYILKHELKKIAYVEIEDSIQKSQSNKLMSRKIIKYDTLFINTSVISVDSTKLSYFPIFKQYFVDLGLLSWDEIFVSTKWLEHKYEFAIFPPITYSSTTRDARNNKFKSPFGPQEFPEDSNGGWHFLGTERIGQDVAAGMIHGTRTAMLVGVVAMSIATFIGLFFGALSGYFGDERLKASRIRILLNLLAFIMAFFFSFISNGYIISDMIGAGNLFSAICVIIAWFMLVFFIANLLTIPLQKIPFLGKKVTVAVDIIIMRLIEVVNSIPLLILILAIVAIIEKPSVLFVMVIIGSVMWTPIAKFIRAELLRIRRLEYIEAAQAFGYSNFRIIMRHAIPNALAPVFIAIAFGVASAILTEAFLSFIGVGIPDDQVTWGSLLRLSRDKFSAWWLAVFPGFAIFITVTMFNLIGEGLTDALDPRLRE
ncbi:MAG: ABC transporter permease [Saprospiraceae bacterium]|nr:ABC transporter permease [Saprospiraceae bacterium]